MPRSPGHMISAAALLHVVIQGRRVVAYNFWDNIVPGTKPYEERSNWRDGGTLDACWQAHMDMLDSTPLLDLRKQEWPILSDSFEGPTPSFARVTTDDALAGQASLVSNDPAFGDRRLL